MNYRIKSKLIKEAMIFNASNNLNDLSVVEASNVNKKENATVFQMILQIPIGYIISLDEVANDRDVKLDLDLTYGTVRNLPAVLAYGFNAWKDSDRNERIDITAKSLAAYLMLLCENEHSCGIEITKPPFVSAETTDFGWTGYIIKTGTKKQIDLLQIAKRAVSCVDSCLTIENKEIEKAYKEMTGVDLSEYGFDGIQACFE